MSLEARGVQCGTKVFAKYPFELLKELMNMSDGKTECSKLQTNGCNET